MRGEKEVVVEEREREGGRKKKKKKAFWLQLCTTLPIGSTLDNRQEIIILLYSPPASSAWHCLILHISFSGGTLQPCVLVSKQQEAEFCGGMRSQRRVKLSV